MKTELCKALHELNSIPPYDSYISGMLTGCIAVIEKVLDENCDGIRPCEFCGEPATRSDTEGEVDWCDKCREESINELKLVDAEREKNAD